MATKVPSRSRQLFKEKQDKQASSSSEHISSEEDEQVQPKSRSAKIPPHKSGKPTPNLSKPAAKRAHREESDEHKKSKKSRKSEEEKPSSTPAGYITRVWSDDDEIALLDGMIRYKDEKGLEPNWDFGAFHSFMNGKLRVGFSKEQLAAKMRRLKMRFLNALKKGQNGEDPVFSNPHEDVLFEISKKIWGDVGENRDCGKNVDITEEFIVGVEEESVGEGEGFWSKYPYLSASFDRTLENFMSGAGMSFVKEKLSSIGNAKAKELEKKWKELIVEETELKYKMLALISENVKMALNQ